jgi:hypothetical protein
MNSTAVVEIFSPNRSSWRLAYGLTLRVQRRPPLVTPCCYPAADDRTRHGTWPHPDLGRLRR